MPSGCVVGPALCGGVLLEADVWRVSHSGCWPPCIRQQMDELYIPLSWRISSSG